MQRFQYPQHLNAAFSYLSDLMRDRPTFETTDFHYYEKAAGADYYKNVAQKQFVGVALPLDADENSLIVLLRDDESQKEAARATRALLRNQFPEVTLVVRPVGEFRTAVGSAGSSARMRPAMGGDSVGHQNGGNASGSFGCLVEDSAGRQLILSCNHVLADVNRCNLGDAIWQPGIRYGGSSRDQIARLRDFEPLTVDGATDNFMDAAIALVDNPADAMPGIRRIGSVAKRQDPAPPSGPLYLTGPESASIVIGEFYSRSASMNVRHPGIGIAVMEHQYLIDPQNGPSFGKLGDSGAIVVDQDNEAVAMLVAVEDKHGMATATPIDRILDRFQVAIK